MGYPITFLTVFPQFLRLPKKCLQDRYLAGEWTYYQEVDNFTGLFQDSVLLNADIFAYWDNVEAEFRQQGFSPKGFSVKEFISGNSLPQPRFG